MKHKQLTDYVTGKILQNLSLNDSKKIMEDWESIYCPVPKSERQSLHISQYRWHTFSSGTYESIDGDNAISEYGRQLARAFYVIPELSFYPSEAFEVDELPSTELSQMYSDFYIFPKNLAWTFAFTHEHGWLGPYFAKHPNYENLNKHNLQSLEAKNKGWS